MKQKELILEQLTSMGFDPVDLDDLGLLFKHEDVNYLYMPEDDAEDYLRITIPQVFEVTDENRAEVLEAMQEMTASLKYAKFCIMYGTGVWALYEHKLTSTENLQDLLEHIICVLGMAANIFCMRMNGEDVFANME